MAVLGLVWMRVVIIAWRRRQRMGLVALVVPLLVVGTCGMLKLYISRRVAFAFCRAEFERRLAAPPAGAHLADLRQRIRPFFVDSWAADPRGGVFFRTGTGYDGIGPDTVSSGFVHRPNMHGTPFGAAGYRLEHLQGDWYWFRASDDWN